MAQVYLDASDDTLKERCSNDKERYMPETIEWYETKYELYREYWKKYPGVIFLNTENKTTEAIYQEIIKLIIRDFVDIVILLMCYGRRL